MGQTKYIPQQTKFREVCLFFFHRGKNWKNEENEENTFPKTPPRNILETPEKETKKDREPNINN